MKRRILSILAALALCLSLCPSWAFAAEGEDPPVRITEQPEDNSSPYFLPLGFFIETEPAVGANGVSCQWYEVKDGVEEKVSNGNGGTGNMFVPDDWLDVGTYQYFCEVTKDGYTVRSNTVTYTVRPYPILAIVEGNVEKVYDGTTEVPEDHDLTVAKISSAIYNKIQITLQAESFRYETASAEKEKAVIAEGVTFSCSDPDKEKNFRLGTILAGKVGIITKAPLTITGADVPPRDYEEGNAAAKIRSLTFHGLVNGETLAIDEDYFTHSTFLDENAGENKPVSVMAFLTSNDKAGNYKLPDPSFKTTGTISRVPWDIQVTGVPTGTITYGDTFTLQSGDALSWRAEGCAGVDGQGNVTVTGAGEFTITATKAGDQNHVDTDYPIYLNSHRKALTVSGAVGGKAYDGTSEVEITGVTLEGIVDGDDVSANTDGLTGTVSGSNAGTYTAVTLPRLTLTGGAASNYELSQSADPVPASVTIRKAAPLPTKAGDLAAANKQAHTYTFGLGVLRPDLPEGMSFGSGAVTYELGTVSLGGYYNGGAKIEGQTLTLPIQAVESDSEGRIGTVTVIIHSENFEDMTATINVRSVNKIIPTGGPTLSANTLTYGQALSAITLSGSMQHNGKAVPGTFTWNSPENRPAVQEKYGAAWTFTPDNQDKYALVTGTVILTISKATPTGTPKYTAISTSGKTLADAGLTTEGGTFSTAGAVAWALADTTEVTANTAYEWIFTPTDTANYTTLTGKITLWPYTPPSNPGGGTYVPSGPGSSTLPVTTTGQGSSTMTTTTAAPTASTQGGTATTTINTAMGNEIIKQAVANRSETVVIAPKVTGSVTKAEVSIPASTVGQIGSQTNASLTVSTPVADVSIPNEGLGSLSGAGGTVTVTAGQTGNTVELTVTAGGRTVQNIPGGVTLTVPMGNTTPGTVAVLVHSDGTREVIRKSVADNGAVTIPLEGSAKLVIVDNSGYFSDVPATSWAADAVAFASAHELFNGTAHDRFSPDQPMSRGMLAVVLHNLESNPAQALTGVFADVDNSQWYAEGVSWAAAQGIIEGYGSGTFGPNDNITREQLAVMLWRYAGSPAATERELHFADAYKASDWAAEALRWAVEKGVLNGKGGGILDPGGGATRAETAQMLMNFLKK